MISILPLISNFSNLYPKLLENVSSVSYTIGISVTLMIHSFLFCSLTTSRCLFIVSLSFIFTLWSARTAKFPNWQVFFFVSINTRSGLLVGIWWSVCILKFTRILRVSFTKTCSSLCIYHLVVWSNFNLWHNFPYIIFLTQSDLVLYFFCASLLHSFTMWLIVSSLSSHLLFCCVLSVFASI